MSLRVPIFALALVIALSGVAPHARPQASAPSAQAKKPAAAPPAAPAAPQSTHYPILLLAFGPATGADPAWSIRIGQKGPERLDRPGYPPAMLDPVDVAREGTSDAWTYRAKDSATGADVAVHITREPCSADATGAKYTFRAVAEHSQIGTLNGCARIAAELFPRINNQPDEDDDTDKKPPVLPADIIKFQSPTNVAYLISTGKVAVAVGKIRKVAAPEGTELALSQDGKRLLFTRSDSKTGPDRTIVLYDTTSGRSQDLVHGGVRQAFWSPDDSKVAYLNFQDQKWQLWTFPAGSPTQAAPLYANSLTSLHGWTDAHTLLASDMQNAYWISDDGRVMQTIALKDIYGEAFDVAGSDTFRVNPINPDLLLVSAPYVKAPAGAPTDAMGLAAGFFLYELRSKRRVVLSTTDEWARHAEWSRDGVQVFYTRRISATSLLTYRILWDGSNAKRYIEGSDLVVGK
ncbi:MAG: hypothetical protein ABSH13_10970 [Candidatus Acidiferrum sp.]|jgi:uncharacterized membrane protein